MNPLSTPGPKAWLTALLLAAVSSTAWSAPPAKSLDMTELPSEEFLAQQGITVVGPLPTIGGLKAWSAYRDQQPLPIYRMPDGKHWLIGTVIDAQGQDVNGQALQAAVQAPMGDRIWSEVQRSRWVGDGKANAAQTVYVFTDPNCPYCHQLWSEARPWVNAGQVQLRHILVGVLRPSSEGKAAAILGASQPEKALNAHALAHTKALAARSQALEGVGIAPLARIPLSAKDTLGGHAALMASLGIRATPAVVWKDRQGLVQVRTGMPPGLLEDMLGPRPR